MSRRVFVGNLAYEVGWQDLKDFMREAGDVVRADVLTRQGDGKSKGCGLVEFSHPTDARRAVQILHDRELMGRPVFIREDREDDNNNNHKGGSGVSDRAGSARGSDRGSDRIGGGSSGRIGSRIYVGNLSWTTSKDHLRAHFSQVGKVKYADIAFGVDGKSKGWGIVVMATPQEAAAVVRELNDTLLDNRPIHLREDREPDRKLLNDGQIHPPQPPSHQVVVQQGNRKRAFDSGPAPVARGGISVYVGNLPYEYQWQELKDLMRQVGDVVRAEVPNKGWGIVEFANPRDARQAIQRLDGFVVEGRQLQVREDREADQGPPPAARPARREVRARRDNYNGSVGRKVFVGNLPFSVAWQDLKDLFREAGDVVRAEVLSESGGRSKGVGIVEFADSRGANNAIRRFNDFDFQGRTLNVREDREER